MLEWLEPMSKGKEKEKKKKVRIKFNKIEKKNQNLPLYLSVICNYFYYKLLLHQTQLNDVILILYGKKCSIVYFKISFHFKIH